MNDTGRLRRVARARLVLALSLLLPACGPVGPFGGGALSGELRGAPSDWSFVAGVEQAQLETRPGDPRSINLWLGSLDGRLYVASSMVRGPKLPSERGWVRDVEADERVRVRIEGVVYELRAERVLDADEAGAVRAMFEAKYGLDPKGRDPEREVWFFELLPR
jgi:hypothetical protein